jgi:ABC-2 type transport system ATP-binding protein
LLAVDNLTFSIAPGEIFGLLGPNGAGKTTTIRLLTGLLRATGGKAQIAGFDLTRIRQAKHQIGVLPETSNLYEELSVWRNLNFVAQLYGVPRRNRPHRITDLLQVFEMADKRDVLFRHLSKGLQRRVALAAALIHDPPILIMDEPTVGLDVFIRRQLHSIIRQLHQVGKTILLTSHYIDEAEQLCDRVLILCQGRIVALDTPTALCKRVGAGSSLQLTLDQPAARFTDLLASLPGVGETTVEGNRISLATSDPGVVVPALITALEANHLKLTSIQTHEPRLEDAFVQLTGLPLERMISEKKQ